MILVLFFNLIKLTGLSCINSSYHSKTFLLLLLQALFLVFLTLVFFYIFPRLLWDFGLLFGLKITRIKSWNKFRLCFFMLFLLQFFDRLNLYQLIILVVLLINIPISKNLYLGLSFNPNCFFDDGIPFF